MKNLKQSSIVFILFFFLFTSTSSFASEKKDSLYVVEIDGKILAPGNDNLKLYRIELLCYDIVVDSVVVVDSESFLLKIKKDSRYTIRIIKKGYYPMSVSVDTKLPVNNNGSYTFHFDAKLIPNNKTIAGDDALKFRIANISFNKRTDTFAFNEMR